MGHRLLQQSSSVFGPIRTIRLLTRQCRYQNHKDSKGRDLKGNAQHSRKRATTGNDYRCPRNHYWRYTIPEQSTCRFLIEIFVALRNEAVVGGT